MVTTTRRWQRRHITPVKAQRAIDALMAVVQTSEWDDVDADTKRTIHGACSALTAIRDARR